MNQTEAENVRFAFIFSFVTGSVRSYGQAQQVLLLRGVRGQPEAREHRADGNEHLEEEAQRSPNAAEPGAPERRPANQLDSDLSTPPQFHNSHYFSIRIKKLR